MRSEDALAVLYVDDEPINLRVFDANFRSKFRVVTCSSGSEALALLATRAHEIGVLISDQRMPEMTGVELLERAREVAPDAQRMLLTAFSDMQAVVDAVNRGQVSRYFVKPWVRDELLTAIQDALRISTLQLRLRDFEHRLLQSERLATIGQVSAGIAHELMNPVGYISQNVGLLRNEVGRVTDYAQRFLQEDPDPAVTETLVDLPQIIQDIETGTSHIRQVALRLRDQARGEDREAACDVSDVATFAVKLSRPEVRQRARVVVEGQPMMAGIGPVKLCQILLNLIVNSAQAMEASEQQGQIHVRWAEREDRVVIEVQDNGAGIPAHLKEKVFAPMFTTKPVGVGTGLGLPICRDLARAAGGDLLLHSEVGVGTRVEILLPRLALTQSN